MKRFSRRKFVETAVAGGIGVVTMSDLDTDGLKVNDLRGLDATSGTGQKVLQASGKEFDQADSPQKIVTSDFDTMRPIRKKHNITITVGQTEGDLRGTDDKVLQAAVDYVTSLGGGTVQILPGTYTMRNALFPGTGTVIRGAGDKTILRKSPSVSSKLIRESDWFEYGVQVEDPTGFTVGGGLALNLDNKKDYEVRLFTVTDIQGNMLFLDKIIQADHWMTEGARASTRFSLIHGLNVEDVTVVDLVLDGNRLQNENIDNDFASAFYLKFCDRWHVKNVIARDYNSDGFSIQACNDIVLEDCMALNNADYGFHPGSGTQRPVFSRCISRGNRQGFYWCWGACDGIAEDCKSVENLEYGFNFGHRDTDNILRNCHIENNGKVGVLFRREDNEYQMADRNLIENCILRNNGKAGSGIGIDLQWKIHDISVRNCSFENPENGSQNVGIRISPEAQGIILENNTYSGNALKVNDLRKKAGNG